MKHPNAFYIGDTLLADNHLVTVLAFVKPGHRQLVKVRFPDGSERTRGFDTLRPRDPYCGCGLWICPDCRPETATMTPGDWREHDRGIPRIINNPTTAEIQPGLVKRIRP